METERLKLDLISLEDAEFIISLLNSPGWLKYIGQRNVLTISDASVYIRRIQNDPNIIYWIVRHKKELTQLGIITLIKRVNLDHHDLGFAFLPQHSGYGYAYEASDKMLKSLLQSGKYLEILGVTTVDNLLSIKLLKKLGLMQKPEINSENTNLIVFTTKNSS